MSMTRWCAVMLATAMGLTGCADAAAPPEPKFANWPAALDDFRFRWAAEPGIDLVSGPAVPLRAYLESYRIWNLTQDPGNVYPGFNRVVPDALPPKSNSSTRNELVDIRPLPEAELFGPPGPFFGNEYFHILELTPTEDGYRAYVCDGMYDIFREGSKEGDKRGKYVSVIDYDARTLLGDIGGLKVWRVELTDGPPLAGAPAVATAAQRGTKPAPVDDVFGPWQITGASDDSWGTVINLESVPFGEPGGVDRISECSDRMPHWRTERDAIIKRVLDTPPSAEPASPGWPDSTT